MSAIIDTDYSSVNAFIMFCLVTVLAGTTYIADYINKQEINIAALRSEVAALREILEIRFAPDDEFEEEEEEEAEDSTVEDVEAEEDETEDTDTEDAAAEDAATEDSPANSVEEPEESSFADDEQVAAVEPEDKHARLLTRLQADAEVRITYKKQTIAAQFKPRADAPNGYVFKTASGEYNTPSHFSTYVKKKINPAIQADNGWDSLYIVTGATSSGKPVKMSLNDLINSKPKTEWAAT